MAFFSVGIDRAVNMMRAQAVGMGVALNRMTSGAVSMSFLSVAGAFAAVSVLSVAFVHWFVPETRSKSQSRLTFT